MIDPTLFFSLIPQAKGGWQVLAVWSVVLLSAGFAIAWKISGHRIENAKSETGSANARLALRDDEIGHLKAAVKDLEAENVRLSAEAFEEVRGEVDVAETAGDKIPAILALIDALTARIDKLEIPSGWQAMLNEAARIREIETPGVETRRVRVEVPANKIASARMLDKLPDRLVRERHGSRLAVFGASSPKQELQLQEWIDDYRRLGFVVTELTPQAAT